MGISKTQSAYSYIKGKIISGELAPSATISEEALQEELEMSRTPIREAILQLQAENFLDIYPRKGVVVAPLTFGLLNEIYDVRRVVEPHLFCSAAGKLPENWLQRIRERFLNVPVPRDNLQKFSTYHENLDWEFCSVVLQSVDNRFLRDSMRQAYDHSRRVCSLSKRSLDAVDEDLKEHVAIVDSMIAKDLDRLAEMVRTHVEHTWRNNFMRFFDTMDFTL